MTTPHGGAAVPTGRQDCAPQTYTRCSVRRVDAVPTASMMPAASLCGITLG